MPVFKNPEFSKIINNSNARIIIDGSKREDEINYEITDEEKKNYQIFFLNNVLYIESAYPSNKPLEIKINKKHIIDIQCKLNSFTEIKGQAHVNNISLFENSSLVVNRGVVENIDTYGNSKVKTKSINKLKKLSSYDDSEIEILKIESENVMINHSSRKILKSNSGLIVSLVVQKNDGSGDVEIKSKVENADLLNNSDGIIKASNIEKSLTVSATKLGGIDVYGKCEEFIHIINDGDNEIRINEVDTQRVHCINSKQSTTIITGKTDNLIYSTEELSFGYFHDLVCSAADITLNDTNLELSVDKSIVGTVHNKSILNLKAPESYHKDLIIDDSSSLSIIDVENKLINEDIKELVQEKITTIRQGFSSISEKSKNVIGK